MTSLDKFEHRRLRMLELVEALRATRALVAKRMGIADSYLTRILYKHGENKQARRISDESITKAREAFGLPAGWFDMPLGHALPPPLPKAEQPSAPPPISLAAHAERKASGGSEEFAGSTHWWPFELDPDRLRAVLTPQDVTRIEAYIRGILDSREAEAGFKSTAAPGK